MKVLRVIIALPVLAYYAAKDRGFRAFCLHERRKVLEARRNVVTPRHAEKLTFLEDIEVHAAAIVCGTAKSIESVAILYLSSGFWKIIGGIYHEAFRREVAGVLERKTKP